jgi:hypothetical protein
MAMPAGMAHAQVNSGIEAYVEQLPTSTGTKVTNTPKKQATPRPAPRPQRTYHPRPAYAPRPAYVAPSVQRATPTYRPQASAPAAKPHHKKRAHRRHRHHAAAALTPRTHASPAPNVPAVPAGSVSGGDHGFTWLAAFMLVVTGAVLAGAHVQRRRPVLRADV